MRAAELSEALIVGLMSGTSADGVDAALVYFSDDGERTTWELRGFVSIPYDKGRRERILAGIESGSARELCRLHADLGEWMSEAVLAVSREAGVAASDLTAIGSHGHTVWHEPPNGAGGPDGGATLQIGDAARLAERTGVQVISDFRARDVAAGGHGAPLVPWADQWLFSHPERNRAIQNIGGMANVTWLPAGASEAPFAFDTGPGVALMDAAASEASGGAESMDVDGRMALEGSVNERLLGRLMRHPFFSEEPPRSTGRETFGRPLLNRLRDEFALTTRGEWVDLVATMTALTVRTIADAYSRWVLPRGVDEVFVTGGGAYNPTLVTWLREALDPLPVFSGNELGVDADAREAVAFAALAWAHLRGIPANVPSSTGARGSRILGCLTPGARR
jgi:anhydro-N-acetylmuramic acid kinase